jgi:hypothetical protein
MFDIQRLTYQNLNPLPLPVRLSKLIAFTRCSASCTQYSGPFDAFPLAQGKLWTLDSMPDGIPALPEPFPDNPFHSRCYDQIKHGPFARENPVSCRSQFFDRFPCIHEIHVLDAETLIGQIGEKSKDADPSGFILKLL